jgi:hypothetical protein
LIEQQANHLEQHGASLGQWTGSVENCGGGSFSGSSLCSSAFFGSSMQCFRLEFSCSCCPLPVQRGINRSKCEGGALRSLSLLFHS